MRSQQQQERDRERIKRTRVHCIPLWIPAHHKLTRHPVAASAAAAAVSIDSICCRVIRQKRSRHQQHSSTQLLTDSEVREEVRSMELLVADEIGWNNRRSREGCGPRNPFGAVMTILGDGGYGADFATAPTSQKGFASGVRND